jgi:hypothetical protein
MKLQEIILKAKENTENKENKKDFSTLINVESYVPLLTKRQIVKFVTNHCLLFDEETGLIENDIILQELTTYIAQALYCTDIDLDELFDEVENDDGEIVYNLNLGNALEAYDLMKKEKIDEYIHKKITNDYEGYDDTCDLIVSEIQQQLSVKNSVSAVLSKAINKLIVKIPEVSEMREVLKELPTQIASLGLLAEPKKVKKNKVNG